jgi:long-chain acyl-CoA synthetase
MKYKNLPDLFFRRAEKYGDKVLIRYKTRLHLPFSEISWDQVKTQVEEIAMGLSSLGVKRGDKVGLLASTCHYWLACDFGILSIGACTVPLYHSSTPENVRYIVDHAELEIVFVRDKIQLQKLRATWDLLPKLRYAIVMSDRGDLPTNDPKILTLDELLQIGHSKRIKSPNAVRDTVQSIELKDLASIIYTSGTTGEPKGVTLTHKNFLVAALSFYQYVPLEEGFNMLSFLPLAHVFERVASEIYGIDQGVIFTYCERVEDLPTIITDSHCNIMCVVPRLLEKIYEKVMSGTKSMNPASTLIFEEAIKAGVDYMKRKVHKETIDNTLELRYKLARRLVLNKIKNKIAPHLKYFIVGGAPFSEDLAYFFLAIGFNVLEGYGLTETTAPISVNPVWDNRPGTVGIPFSHFEVKTAEDEEILCRGGALFQGYYKNPQATAEAIDSEGWFHTGDLGSIDADGYLRITGRKKDLIITAGGKNIAPTKVENTLLQSKYISQAVVFGDKEKYLAALLVLNTHEVEKWLTENKNQEIKSLVESEIEICNRDLASYEQIKTFAILNHELTIDGGELTPTHKVKRNIVRQKYDDLIRPLFCH